MGAEPKESCAAFFLAMGYSSCCRCCTKTAERTFPVGSTLPDA